MAALMKYICLLTLLVVLVELAGVQGADGVVKCGTASQEALASCAEAAKDEHAVVPESCCAALKKVGHPSCFCNMMLKNANSMQKAGLNLEAALTIPKRCNLERPVGYKCGAYEIP
ncbi:Bifunctional inhibitor/plant lipid transfer protein/seed storage helical domain [Macleaya cordata]|uniref:Bifunctional inhibitor/plant lipid transfer protein/seed storage helical domain n=1 Tax=Macleaya cordata TaxID=56857 RepID=A0A200R4V3_MACCD|nr:Bifunctional inhibitor/plant lipid transfer protein/seed storage helical domain [Macleaya cordata]